MSHVTHLQTADHAGILPYPSNRDAQDRARQERAREMFALYAKRARAIQQVDVEEADALIAQWRDKDRMER